MEEKIIERRIQQSHESLLLTIPRAIVAKAGIRRGQSVRLPVRDGKIVISPMGILGDSTPDSVGSDKFERVITKGMAKDISKGPDVQDISPRGASWRGSGSNDCDMPF